MSKVSKSEPSMLSLDNKIYVAGHRGLAGGAIWDELKSQGYSNLVGATSAELDLTNRSETLKFLEREKPDVIVIAAAKVGGIKANNDFPVDFLSQNLAIQLNIMDAANKLSIPRLLFLGSSCIYPKFAEQPIKETSLLTGALEETNEAYAIAKIAGIMHVDSSRKQFGRHWISAMPTNLYGPGDNFHPEHSHVLPALIQRFHAAKIEEKSEVILWGTGTPKREFMFVKDLAKACIHLLKYYDAAGPINVGTGKDLSIRELAEIVARVVGFEGQIVQDLTKPDGTPRKLLDVSRLTESGWVYETELFDGVTETYEWFLKSQTDLRSK